MWSMCVSVQQQLISQFWGNCRFLIWCLCPKEIIFGVNHMFMILYNEFSFIVLLTVLALCDNYHMQYIS